jgi:hypothetical protein
MNKNEQLQAAIDKLSEFASTTNNMLYDHHSPESLKKELSEIYDCMFFLETLKDEGEPS